MSHAVADPPVSGAPAIPQHARNNPSTAPRRPFRFVTGLWRSLPTLLVLAVLAGLGYYGHHSGWKLPKFSTLAGAAPAAKDDWCEEHGVPESQCVECDPDLLPKGPDYGWCPVHGVHNCPLEHPDVAQLKQVPDVSQADLERAARALALQERPSNNRACTLHQRRIQFASVEAVRKAGVDVELVDRQPISEWVAGNGEITYDQTRLASLSSRAPGIVTQVDKQIGDAVRQGEILALVDAAEVGRAKTELVQALAEENLQRLIRERLQGLSGQGVVAARQSQEAEAAYLQARARVLSAQQTLSNFGLPIDAGELRGLSEEEILSRLRFLGLPASLGGTLDPRALNANLIPVRAPTDGIVIEREVVAGEVVDTARVLFRVADTSRMWLTLSVPLEEARKLALGQPVRFRPDGSRTEVKGTLNWISTAADGQTRMVTVRADLPNPDGSLRDETFGQGRIILREEPEAIVVPNQAIHWDGSCHVVFVRDKGYFDSPESPKVFHVRSIRPGAKEGGFTEIIAGVLPGEVVAVTGSDVLQAQLLKNNLGEGCACGAD